MVTVMKMDSYEIEHDPAQDEYGEEVLSSGWNPALNWVCPALSLQSARRAGHDHEFQNLRPTFSSCSYPVSPSRKARRTWLSRILRRKKQKTS